MAVGPGRCYVAPMASFLSSIILPIAVGGCCDRAAAWPHQHDAGRFAEPFAKPDAAAGAAAVHRHRHHHDRGLGDGQIGKEIGQGKRQWSCSIEFTRGPAMTAPRRSAAANAARNTICGSAAYGTVDETNAAIGVVRLHLAEARELDRDAGPDPERPVRSRRRSRGARSATARRSACGCCRARSSGWSATSIR